jgi:hypothetical protein
VKEARLASNLPPEFWDCRHKPPSPVLERRNFNVKLSIHHSEVRKVRRWK